jgi:hypothetical protein
MLLLSVGAFAQADEFRNVVDFSMSTRDLVEIVRDQRYDLIDPAKYYVLTGSVASTLILDPAPDSFSALIELVAGEWVGLDSIEVYRVYVLLEGPQYATRVLERLPRNPGPEVILPNSDLLLVAQFLGETEWEDGSFIPVVAAIDIR